MFERYTEKARRVIFFARYEASTYGSITIESEHLLLGLLREDHRLLASFVPSAKEQEIRADVDKHSTIRAKVSTSIDLPLSQECKRALAYAAEESERLKHPVISTEHLLLGLLRVEESFAASILRERGVDISQFRATLADAKKASAARPLVGYRYLHLDVFTDTALTGNQLAVFLPPTGFSPELMQRVALEMAFSETTFVLLPDAPDIDARVRIFTPRSEIPMAGHPTIGTTFALAQEGWISRDREEITLGLRIGPTKVRLEWNPLELRFAWMVQPLPVFGKTVADLRALAEALGVGEADIRSTGSPAQELSAGVPFLFVPLISRAAVDSTVANQNALSRFFQKENMQELAVFVFSTEPANDDANVYSRMFAPSFGVPEDAATGGASGPLGAYLVHYGVVRAEPVTRILSLQGVKMGRPSRIHISVTTKDGAITEVLVGGRAVVVGEGTIRLSN
jgi:trans-2,3-dihydro-3-hydroxyanthranilate isomerase